MASRAITTIIWVLFLLTLAAPLFLKGLHVEDFIYTRTGDRWLGAFQVLANDAVIFATIAITFYISFLRVTPRALSIAARVTALTVFLIYLIDCLVILNFNTHLTVADAIKYASYAPLYIRQVYGENLPWIAAATLGLMIPVTAIVLSGKKIAARKIHIAAISAIAVLLSAFCLSDSGKYIHSWIYINFISYNKSVFSESKGYSKTFIDRFSYTPAQHCYASTPEWPNVVILMVESLSSYQSRFFSGIENWTPQLDRIARDNLSFPNFYANGFTTEDAEIAILTGRLPIYPPSSYTNGGGTSFTGFYGVQESLPNVFKQYGYRTEFLTTADLKFSNSGAWAKSIGFDHVEGHDHASYEGWDRFHFKAAPDRALYERVVERIRRHGTNRFFFFVKTVTSHHPFHNPENRIQSESETFRYVDKQLGRFYKELKEIGFFDRGMLIIVGDHRAMIPLKVEEVEVFGQLRSAARVPLVISYSKRRALFDGEAYQQVDIFQSLKNLLSGTACISDWTGDLLRTEPVPAKYIAHRRGDYRDIISVFSSEGDYQIKLAGDRTRVIGSILPDDSVARRLVTKVNALRIHPCGQLLGPEQAAN